MSESALAVELQALLDREPLDLAAAALVVAKIEYPRLDPRVTIDQLNALGDRAARQIDRLEDAPVRTRLAELSRFLYAEVGFAGDRAHYGDFRNSLLNVVVERRLGIPISLALVYTEVSRRCGIEVFGVSFPGHFLVRVPDDAGREGGDAIILDPFGGGREMDELACHELLERQIGESVAFDQSLLAPCTGRQWLARMLNNLKRTYVEQRSFPQALLATELLYAVDPASGTGLRDRGLLAYHLDDFPSALRDLEQYLRLRNWQERDREERDRVVEHVKTLRGRVAGLN